jgi:hypothetical protein
VDLKQVDVCRFLLQAGCDPNVVATATSSNSVDGTTCSSRPRKYKNFYGRSPRQVAMDGDSDEIMQLFAHHPTNNVDNTDISHRSTSDNQHQSKRALQQISQKEDGENRVSRISRGSGSHRPGRCYREASTEITVICTPPERSQSPSLDHDIATDMTPKKWASTRASHQQHPHDDKENANYRTSFDIHDEISGLVI